MHCGDDDEVIGIMMMRMMNMMSLMIKRNLFNSWCHQPLFVCRTVAAWQIHFQKILIIIIISQPTNFPYVFALYLFPFFVQIVSSIKVFVAHVTDAH